MGQSKELNDLYNKAMTNTSKMQVAAVLASFSFNSYSHIVDVGGGLGFFISAILSKYKTIQGTLFDLPQVVNNRVDGNNFEGRLKIIAGSFFETIPAGGDLYLLKNILHGWSDDDCIAILKNIRKVLSDKGRLMIIEVVVESMNKPSWGKMTDIFMMAGLGGRERTRKEYKDILEKAGYKIDQFRPTVSPASLIIASLDGNN
jgi:hypothetical protein